VIVQISRFNHEAAALKGLDSLARGETPGHNDSTITRTLKGFNPYRVGAGIALTYNPRVAPLAMEFLPFREKKHTSINLFGEHGLIVLQNRSEIQDSVLLSDGAALL
jgi:hypothetical protein